MCYYALFTQISPILLNKTWILLPKIDVLRGFKLINKHRSLLGGKKFLKLIGESVVIVGCNNITVGTVVNVINNKKMSSYSVIFNEL